MHRIYHITSQSQQETARKLGWYEPDDFSVEGFIHCSFAHQIESVANRFFQGHTDLVVLEIDPKQLNCDVVSENLEGGSEQFPHIYGRLPYTAIGALHTLRESSDGTLALPKSIRTD